MVWCDPQGYWGPLLQGVSRDSRMGGFTLVEVTGRTAGAIGGPLVRSQLQARLDAQESLVLYVPAPREELGWLWAQALLSERIYDRSLREQLLEWGWRPQSLKIDDEELAVIARQNLQQDPTEWGGGGLQPSVPLLLEVLAGGAAPTPDDSLILDLTIEAAGLPTLDPDNVPRWRTRCLARLLVSEAHRIAPRLISDDHELLIDAGHRTLALQILDHWLDSLRLSKGLPEAVIEADSVAALAAQVRDASVKHGPFLSHSAERTVFANTCSRLAQRNGKELLESLAGIHGDIERHAGSFWGQVAPSQQALPWGELLRLSRAARLLLESTPEVEWGNPEEAIAWYTSTGWRIDQAGEELLRNLVAPVQELLALVGPLRAAYRALWERTMIQWSQVWSAAGCPVPACGSAGEWLAKNLTTPRPTAVLVVDALRYGVGATFAERLNQKEGVERGAVSAARAPLPSITALGMGMALPIQETDLEADLNDAGRWRLRQSGRTENLSEAQERRNWWYAHGSVATDAMCSMADVLTGNIPGPAQKRTRLVIYDATIDKLGHDDELEAMGTGTVLDRYLIATDRLREAGWSRILVVTDHGYIHWPTSDEKNVPFPAPSPAYTSRRALAYPVSVPLKGPQALAPGCRWRVAVPSGAASFRTYGGLGYFHGGASLQEWIIPCIAIEWPMKARPVDLELVPSEQVLSQRPRVSLRVQRASLLVEDATPREVDVVIRDAGRRTILFRSDPTAVTPDRDQISIGLRAVDGSEAARGTELSVEVRDTRTEEIIAAGTSTLMIEMTGW